MTWSFSKSVTAKPAAASRNESSPKPAVQSTAVGAATPLTLAALTRSSWPRRCAFTRGSMAVRSARSSMPSPTKVRPSGRCTSSTPGATAVPPATPAASGAPAAPLAAPATCTLFSQAKPIPYSLEESAASLPSAWAASVCSSTNLSASLSSTASRIFSATVFFSSSSSCS